jgi:hypothetical protein
MGWYLCELMGDAAEWFGERLIDFALRIRRCPDCGVSRFYGKACRK